MVSVASAAGFGLPYVLTARLGGGIGMSVGIDATWVSSERELEAEREEFKSEIRESVCV